MHAVVPPYAVSTDAESEGLSRVCCLQRAVKGREEKRGSVGVMARLPQGGRVELHRYAEEWLRDAPEQLEVLAALPGRSVYEAGRQGVRAKALPEGNRFSVVQPAGHIQANTAPVMSA